VLTRITEPCDRGRYAEDTASRRLFYWRSECGTLRRCSFLFSSPEFDLEESNRNQSTVAGIKGGVSGRLQMLEQYTQQAARETETPK